MTEKVVQPINNETSSSGDMLENILGNSFVFNDYSSGKQVYKTISENLEKCDEFLFTVAFINDSGLDCLKQKLRVLKQRGIKGKIITTNYLFFSQPKALRDLLKMENIEVKMFYLDNSQDIGFHTKGYLFRRRDEYTILIGSSNLTQSALTSNKEWNTLIIGKQDAIAVQNVLQEFDHMWKDSLPLEQVIDEYEKNYMAYHVIHKVEQEDSSIYKVLKPNSMQLAFIARLNEVVNSGEKRGLLISATGTGKTYASAYGVKGLDLFKPQKLLFISHRERILSQAKKTFDVVFENSIKSAIFTGNNHEIDGKNYIFASFNMLIRKEHREKFKPDEFDFIIIDEVHRVGDNKYQDIIDYFKPRFLLGMSATPDRTDGYDLYKLFDYNILYEVRLMSALESLMLVPFHYFGINDITVDGMPIDDLTDFSLLTADERVKNIIEQVEYYGYSGDRAKGLVFVRSKDEGKELSIKFNEKGYKTKFLDAESEDSIREKSISMLEEDDITKPHLDYIFTYDIFNEGVDIPSVNQIILLRPTKSSIVFIQQLGRGLRLFKGKEYVNILDFIGNYKNNYCIAKALVKNKVTPGEVIKATRDPLPGCSTISFDPIASERIYQSIDRVNLSENAKIFKDYQDVKQRFGRIPTMLEFEMNSEYSSKVFMTKKGYSSYYEFLVKKDKDFTHRLSTIQANMLGYVSVYFGDGKRVLEIEALDSLVRYGILKPTRNIVQDTSIRSFLDGSFANHEALLEPGYSFIEESQGLTVISSIFAKQLENKVFKDYLSQIIDYARYANKQYFNSSNDFVLFEQYSRKDVCRIINNPKNEDSTMYGYKFFKDLGVLPAFVSYHKRLEENSSTDYPDKFINENTFTWCSRSNCESTKGATKEFIDAYKAGKCKILLFVQKANSKLLKDKQGSDFYYLGECKIESYRDEVMKVKEGTTPVVKFTFILEKPCRQDVYDYIVSSID